MDINGCTEEKENEETHQDSCERDEEDASDGMNKAQNVLSSSFGVKVIDCTCWEAKN